MLGNNNDNIIGLSNYDLFFIPNFSKEVVTMPSSYLSCFHAWTFAIYKVFGAVEIMFY